MEKDDAVAGDEGRVHLQVREQHGRDRELSELLLHIGVVHERAPSVCVGG